MGLFKNRTIQVSFPKGENQPELVAESKEPANYAEDVQETVRIISAHVIMGVGAYVLLDTFRQVIIKVTPGH